MRIEFEVRLLTVMFRRLHRGISKRNFFYIKLYIHNRVTQYLFNSLRTRNVRSMLP